MRRAPSSARTRRTVPVVVLVLAFGGLAGLSRATAAPEPALPTPARTQPAKIQRAPAKLTVAKAPADLPVITYRHVPDGFPADPDQSDTFAATEGLHAPRKLALYDAPGGKPRAFLPPSIRGVEITVPIVARDRGWVAVLLPSVNRRIGWLPGSGWHRRPLPDQLVLRRAEHELTWLHEGVRRQSWTVATGSRSTPTPLGRTFVLGRTGTHGAVYAGLDALVLGAVPDDRDAVAPGLKDAHTGIHAWYRASVFGRSVSNGCIRMPADAQRRLLAEIGPGTPVTVLD